MAAEAKKQRLPWRRKAGNKETSHPGGEERTAGSEQQQLRVTAVLQGTNKETAVTTMTCCCGREMYCDIL